MANMTFKASLLPNTDLGYSLGSDNQRWNIYGNCVGYLPLAGGTMTGHITYSEKSNIFKIDRKKTDGGGWAYAGTIYRGQDDETFANIGVFGSANTLTYMYIGSLAYDSANNLKVYPNGSIVAQKLTLLSNQDAAGTADNKPALIVGGESTAQHIEIDSNEILSKSSGTESSTLYLQDSTGTVQVSGTGGLKVFDISIAANATTDAAKRTISSASTLYLNRASGTSILFQLAGSEHARWDTNGHLKPAATNTYQLGLSGSRWKAVFIGTANTYGSTSSPIYWNAGVPEAVNANSTCNAFINALTTGTSTPTDADYYISQYVGGGTTTTTYHRRPHSSLWAYIKGKADGTYVNITGDTMTGNLDISKSAPMIGCVDTANNNLKCSLHIGSGHQNHGVYSNGYAPSGTTFTSSSKWIIYRSSDGEAHSQLKIYGAVWNDYAEYRETKEEIEPGRCVCETGKGDLVLTDARLQEGCEIVSDTFDFAIGESEKCKTPTAATGRVLAYLYEDRELAKPGRPVCSGPDGTISLMTNEEAREYPWCIIGTVSEIPNYKIWYAGSDGDQKIKVNGRIWIRIR